MRIDYPTDAERDASIDAILAAGLDPQPTLRHALGGLYRILRLRGMLFGVWDCVLLAVLLSGCAAVPLMGVLLSRAEPRLLLYPLTGGAPLLYAALLLLTFWKEEQLGTRELKMTVLYDLRQLTALRLLLFSGMAALGNVLLAACAAAFCRDALLFAQLLSLSLGALCVYIALTLLWLLRVPARFQPVLPALWAALCLLPPVFLPEALLAALLDGLPLAGTALLAVLAAATAGALLRTYLLTYRKDDPYAYG